MIKLTEEMIIARTRISDLSNVKKLNCWGADLQDVSLLRKMPNVEVLALSVNQIKTLADFQYCNRLQELYIRKNDIKDLRDICYLKGLSNLRNLWLADNPCSEVEGYRMTVLRALPQLEKLDDILVKPEDIQEAARIGRDLTLPNTEEDDSESPDSFQSNDSLPSAPPVVHEKPLSRKTSEVTPPSGANLLKNSPITSSPDLIESYQPQSIPEELTLVASPINDDTVKRRFSAMATSSPPVHERHAHSESAPVSRRSSLAASSTFSPVVEHNSSSMTPSPSTEHIHQSRCPVHHSANTPNMHSHTTTSPESRVENISNYNSAPVAFSTATSSVASYPTYSTHQPDSYNSTSINEYSRSHYSVPEQRHYRTVHDVVPSRSSSSNYLLGSTHHPIHSSHDAPISSTPGSERSSPTRSGGRNRHRGSNFSNLLMATLCLVNELDYGSLEVLAMAVRNRLDELDD